MGPPDANEDPTDEKGIVTRRTYLQLTGASGLGLVAVGNATAGNQAPYDAAAGSIPGEIQAEHFDEGGEGVAYHDTSSKNKGVAFREDEAVDIQAVDDSSGRYNVGWIKDGEWLEFTTDVSAGTYDLDLRVSSKHGGGTVTVSLDGTDLGSVDVPDTGGWQSWTTVTIPEVSLDGGTGRTLRLDFAGGGGYLFNVNWVRFIERQRPYDDATGSIPGEIQAEHFDEGGEGVAYHDTSSTNEGGAFRTDEAVDVEETVDSSGRYNVGWIESGEWLEFTTDVSAGTYDVALRVATNAGGNTLTVSMDDVTLGSVDVPDTGGWQNWTTVTIPDVSLDAGTGRTLRLDFAGGSGYLFNVNYVEFVSGSGDTTAPSAPSNLSSPSQSSSTVDLSWDAATDDVGVDHYNVYVDGSLDTQVTTTSATVDGLRGATTYDVHVTAVDGAGNESDPSDTLTVSTTDGTAPSAPSNLTSPSQSAFAVDLSWDASSDNVSVDHYNVYVDGTRDTQVAAGTTSTTVDGLTQNTTYDVHVTAVDGAGNESDPSNAISVTTHDTTAPTAPSNLSSPDQTSSTVDLSWDASSDDVGVDHYNVYVDGARDTQVAAGMTSATVDNLSAGTTYDFYVTAVDGAGNESGPSNTLGVSTSDGTAPTAPSNLSSPGHTASSVDLSWDASSDDVGLDHYNVYVDGARDTQVPAGTTTATVDALAQNTTYDFHVTAVDGAGNESDASTTVSVTTDEGQSPFDGTTRTIPGEIQAEHFDEGGESVAYHDADADNQGGAFRTSEGVDVQKTDDSSGTYNVGWIEDGEWLEFTTDVTGGTYDLDLRVAANNSDGTVTVSLDGTVLGSVDVPDTGGWQSWTTMTIANVSVAGGSSRTLRLDFAGGSGYLFNVNYVEFVSGSGDTTAPTAPSNLSSPSQSSSTVGLSWDAATDDVGVDHYNVYVDGTRDTQVAAGTTSATVDDLTQNTTYDVHVTAVDGAGNESDPSNAISVTTADATTGDFTAVSDGRWSDPGTWKSGTVPTDGSAVAVQEGVTVTVAQPVSTRVTYLDLAGTLRHASDTDTRLRVETLETRAGSRYEMGTESTPIQTGATAELEFIDEGPIDETEWPDRTNKGLLVHGEVEVVGAAKTPWTTLARHPTAGDTSIELSAEPTNWRAGDEIVVPGLEAYSSADLQNADEEQTIASVSGTTVSFDTALEYDHVPPQGDLDTYVVNLSRNARFFSESSDHDRFGHVMLMAPGQTIRYLETHNVGRTEKGRDATSPLWGRGVADPDSPPNPRARYAIHSHRTGPTSDPHYVVGCSVRDNPGWGIVNHDSNMIATDNVTYRIDGAGLVAEKGTEVGAFRRNFALRSAGSGEQTESRKGWSNSFANKMMDAPHNIDDFGHSGHGMWMQSPLVAVEDNVMAGHRHTPITWWSRALYEQPLDSGEALDGKHDMFPLVERSLLTADEEARGTMGDECPPVGDCFHEKDATKAFTDSLPIRSFSGNVAFGCGGGFDISRVMFRNFQTELTKNEHGDNTLYNVGPLYLDDGSEHLNENFTSSGNVGLDHRYVGWVRGRNYRLIGTGDGIGVYRNHAYIDGYDLYDSEIRNWRVGLIPANYKHFTKNVYKNNTFAENDVDIELRQRFSNKSGGGRTTWFEGNTYSGNTTIHWDELHIANLRADRVVTPHSGLTWEGRTVYHGWSKPDFVLVQEGDTERLDRLLKNKKYDEWQELLNGDDPSQVLPGATHEELYDAYGITFYGGILDPSEGEVREDFSGSGGAYDTTPYLGPATKTMPTDEIWVDVVNHCDFRGDVDVVQYGDGVPNEAPLQRANDQTAVQLNRETNNADLPVESTEGVASYEFSIDTTGTYNVFTRGQQGLDSDWGSNDSNSRFYVRMDGGPWKLYTKGSGLHPKDDLTWQNRTDRAQVQFELTSTGSHTVEIAGKGAGMRLDWLLIKHDSVAATPDMTGKPHTD